MYATKNRLNQVFIVALHVLAELLETLLAAVLSMLAFGAMLLLDALPGGAVSPRSMGSIS